MSFKFFQIRKTKGWKKVYYVYGYDTGLFSFMSSKTHIEDFKTKTEANTRATDLNKKAAQIGVHGIAYAVGSRWDAVEDETNQ